MLRLLDFGRVQGLRSQTLWHGIAETMRPRRSPVLSIMTPADPYVSIGFHRRADELDLAACAARGFAVYRRRAGGGPVLCDDGQLFFQLIAPAGVLPAALDRAWERALGPAVEAFRSLGIPAALGPGNDILSGDRKISGTGAARIGDADVFVGNVIFDFDYDAMADVLALSAGAKREAARLMRRFLAPIRDVAGRAVSREEAVAALVAAYGDAFGGITLGTLEPREQAAVEQLDARFCDPASIFADRAPAPPRVKIRSGVSLLVLGTSWVTVVDDRIDRASLDGGWVPSAAARRIERALGGRPVDERALSDAVGDACQGWDRREELVGAIVAAYRRGDR